MAWTQSDLDALDTAIKAGVKRVRFADGRETEYHSLKEMIDLRSTMRAQLLADASQVNPRTRTTVGRLRRD